MVQVLIPGAGRRDRAGGSGSIGKLPWDAAA